MNFNHFGLTLDTLAPAGSITRPAEWIRVNSNLTLTYGDAVCIKVWFDTLDSSHVSKSSEGYLNAQWIAPAATKLTEFITDGAYYYHLVVLDNVGNESDIYTTDIINYNTAITTPTIEVTDPAHSGQHTIITTTTNILYSVACVDSDINSVVLTIVQPNGVTFSNSGSTTYNVSGSLDSTTHIASGTFSLAGANSGDQIVIRATTTDRAGNTASTGAAGDTAHPDASFLLDTGVGQLNFTVTDYSGNTVNEGSYHNYSEQNNTNNFTLTATCSDTDIVGYKVWEGEAAAEPLTWTEYTPGSAFVLPASAQNRQLATSGTPAEIIDGTKKFNVKIIDQGNNTNAAYVSFTVDKVLPVIDTFSSNKTVISKNTGYNTATLTLAAHDDVSSIAGYEISVSGVANPVETGSSLPPTTTLSADQLGVGATDGNYTITLKVTDGAGNEQTSSFVIRLDTTGPSITAPTITGWKRADFSTSFSFTDQSNVVSKRVWLDKSSSSSGTGQFTPITAASTGNIQVDVSSTAFTINQGTNYLHLELQDEVGNTASAYAEFSFDNVAPTLQANFQHAAYHAAAAVIELNANDATSGMSPGGYMVIYGADIGIPQESAVQEAYQSTKSVNLDTTKDGTKRAYVKVIDAAGNETSFMEISCELDQSTPLVNTFQLFDKTNSDPVPAQSTDNEFYVHLKITDTPVGAEGEDANPTVYYKIYGNFDDVSGGTTPIPEGDWVVYSENTPAGSPTYLLLGPFYGIPGATSETTIQVTLKVKDSAGNEIEPQNQSFVYDTSAPEVTVDAPDQGLISCTHNLRRSNNSGTIVPVKQPAQSQHTELDWYGDEFFFSFTPDSVIKQWKVCAYPDATAALAGDAATDPAISESSGSVHMSYTYPDGQEANDTIYCKINGNDFRSALGGSGSSADGAHIVVVYVKDLSGQWSELADFTPTN